MIGIVVWIAISVVGIAVLRSAGQMTPGTVENTTGAILCVLSGYVVGIVLNAWSNERHGSQFVPGHGQLELKLRRHEYPQYLRLDVDGKVSLSFDGKSTSIPVVLVYLLANVVDVSLLNWSDTGYLSALFTSVGEGDES